MNGTYHNGLFWYDGYLNRQFECVLNFSIHGPHMRVWTHQLVCTSLGPLSGRVSILWQRFINIMIILLPRSVCVRTIVKEKRYHQMHEAPTFFHFHCHLTQPHQHIPSYHIILSYHFAYHLSYHLSHLSCIYARVIFHASSSFCMSIISYHSCYTCHIITFSCFQT